MPLVLMRASGSALFGAANELAAEWRDGKVGGATDLEMRRKVYVTLAALCIVGLPLLAASEMPEWGYWIEDGAEGLFDGLAAIVGRNTARAVMLSRVPEFVPL